MGASHYDRGRLTGVYTVMEQADNETKLLASIDFLRAVKGREDLCEATFDAWVSSEGIETTRVLEALGTVLSCLDCIASCRWSCRGGSHLEEHLIDRALSNFLAAHRLLKIGYFDQAGNIIRQIGETASLFYLFMESNASYVEWLNASEKGRREKFGPRQVRTRLTALSLPLLWDNKMYQLFSRALVHVSPSIEPRNHRDLRAPAIGSNYRPAASVLTIMSLSTMAVTLLLFGNGLLQGPGDKKNVLNACAELTESLNSIDTESIRQRLDETLGPSSFQDAELAAQLWQDLVQTQTTIHMISPDAETSRATGRV